MFNRLPTVAFAQSSSSMSNDSMSHSSMASYSGAEHDSMSHATIGNGSMSHGYDVVGFHEPRHHVKAIPAGSIFQAVRNNFISC
jgi:hypothetical protein